MRDFIVKIEAFDYDRVMRLFLGAKDDHSDTFGEIRAPEGGLLFTAIQEGTASSGRPLLEMSAKDMKALLQVIVDAAAEHGVRPRHEPPVAALAAHLSDMRKIVGQQLGVTF